MKKYLLALPLLLMAFFNIPLNAQTSNAPPEEFSTFSVWSQRMDMSQFKGKKYRLSVAIMAEPGSTTSYAVAFIRNEPPKGGKLAWTYMDNMADRPVRDKTWKTYTLQYVIDKKAPWIAFGMLGFGKGIYYFDDMRLEVETSTDQWTAIPIPNGDFEQETIAPWEQTSRGAPLKVIGATAETDSLKPFEGKQCFKIKNVFLN